MSIKVIIVILLFALAVGGAVGLALYEGGVEYRTVGQLVDGGQNRRVKVKAQVLSISSEFKPTVFTAADIPDNNAPLPPGAPTMTVIYEGDDVPQNLKRAAHVTLEGRWDDKRGAFIATMIQTQCPSRYEGQELTPPDPAQP